MANGDMYLVHGRWMTMGEVAKEYHIRRQTLYTRMRKGMTMEQAVDIGAARRKKVRHDWGGGVRMTNSEFTDAYCPSKGWLDYLLYIRRLSRPAIHRMALRLKADSITDEIDIEALPEEPEPKPEPEPVQAIPPEEISVRKVLHTILPGQVPQKAADGYTVTGDTYRWSLRQRPDGLYELHALTLTTGEETSGPWLYTRGGTYIRNERAEGVWQSWKR